MIEVYDNTLTKEECERIIFLFEKDERKLPGTAGGNISRNWKASTDISLNFHDKDEEYNAIIYPKLEQAMAKYYNRYQFLMSHAPWETESMYNLQKYEDGEGYFALHAEEGYHLNRMLVWMIYLNDSECGTEFPYQETVTQAKEGSCVIWPAAWTHPHKGVTPNIGEKYIATGWGIYI